MATDFPKSEEFYHLIQRARRFLRRHALLIGGTLLAISAIGWLSAAVAVDLLIPMATTFRVLFAVGFWSVLIGGMIAMLVWPSLRRMTLEEVALRIERTVGGMHNRLLTVLDLHRADAVIKKRSNPEMVVALLRQTRMKLANFRIRQMVDRVPLLRSLSGLAAVSAFALLLTVVFRESAPTALARILYPTADIPPVTWLRIEAPGELVAPAGDPLTLGVDITRGEVDSLSLHLQQPDGNWVIYPMQRDADEKFSYTLSGVMSDYRYKVSGGGTWTAEYPIHMVPRPIIDAVTASIRLPLYMRRDDRLSVADDATRIEAPIDSHLELAAAVSGDVARGEIVLLKRLVDTHEEVQDEEHVWFEDDLPADAQTDLPWRWSTARAFTGLKSFTFGRTRQPFGFTTRLSPLQVPASGLFYVRTWLEASDPPGRITLRLQKDNETRAFEWGENSTVAANGQSPAVYVGPLPQPAQWARLEVPADVLGSAVAAVKIRGMSLEVDRGQVFFDRPGYLTRKSQSVDTVQFETVDILPMHRDEASGRWLGEVLVTSNRLVTVRFYSSLNQVSADREPLELIATKDQPPTIVVEKPAQDVVLPAVQPLPISAKVFDDWGIAGVGIQLGPSEGALLPVRWQEGDQALATARNSTLVIDPKTEKLAPGQTLFYRLVAKDCNAQIAESKTYKLSIAAPDRAGAPETAKPPESLEQLIKVASQLAQAPHKDQERAEFVAALPPALREAIDSQGEFRQPDGSPMPAEEVRKAVDQAESQLTPEQQSRLAELTAELDRRQQELKNLAEMLKQAAQKSAASPLALQQESNLLNQLAGQAGKMAAELSPPTAAQGKPAMVERELKTEKPAANQTQHLAELEQQLRQLDAARQQVASDPLLARQMLDDQAAQVAGAAAARELEALATDLAARARQLQAMQAQTNQLAQQTPAADAKKLATLSTAQTELDRVAVAAIDQLHDILGKSGNDKQPPAPWTPPSGGSEAAPGDNPGTASGDKPDAAPVGQNVPGVEKKGPSADKKVPEADKKDQGKDQAPANAAADEKRWDKPASLPVPAVGGAPGAESDRQEGDDRSGEGEKKAAAPDGKNAQPKPAQQTPRRQLATHQAQMEQALGESADEAIEGSAAARELARRLRESSLGKAPPSSTATTAEAGGEERGEQTAADESERAADTKETLADPATKQALEMAQRMRRGPQSPLTASHATKPGQEKPPGQPGGRVEPPKTVNVQSGNIAAGQIPLGSDPNQRARFYQLPPRLRGPLLEGMQERGPEGYQPMIDAYFRELSKEIK